MAELKVDSKNIFDLFSNSEFLIPDYQRQYEWDDNECNQLWDDIFAFAFPNNNSMNFNIYEHYFLGAIVTCKHGRKSEIIDGQQRIITLSLLLRAFYAAFDDEDPNARNIKYETGKCIWKPRENDVANSPNFFEPRFISEVATDDEREEFSRILITGKLDKNFKSRYARNYNLFQDKISELKNYYNDEKIKSEFFLYMPKRIINNCILLPIEADKQESAFTIFSTINQRGRPLSDSDIFKTQLYKSYLADNAAGFFIAQWKSLEDTCRKIFNNTNRNPRDEIFSRYMYYERALNKIAGGSNENLRAFYSINDYELFKAPKYNITFQNIMALLKFWEDVDIQNSYRFSERVLKMLLVLNYVPNTSWPNLVSVYFLHKRNADNMLDDDEFYKFLSKTAAFLLVSNFVKGSVNIIKSRMNSAMNEIINNKNVSFGLHLFKSQDLISTLKKFEFTNRKPITKSILAWWMYHDSKDDFKLKASVSVTKKFLALWTSNDYSQEILPADTNFEIEHIYSKRREINNPALLESIGNKALLEKNINIRASDYRFQDKIKCYIGNKKSKNAAKKRGTRNFELVYLANQLDDFNEDNIKERSENIINAFVKFAGENNLLS